MYLQYIASNPKLQLWVWVKSYTGWISDIWKKIQANILREPLVLLKQTIPQQKALDLSLNLTLRKWAWHYQEGATFPRREKHRCAWGKKSCSTAGGRDSSMVMPHPLLGWQMKAEIKGFLLRYRLFQYKHWFLPNFELKYFPEYTATPCTFIYFTKLKVRRSFWGV